MSANTARNAPRIAVISDVHANATAFQAALACARKNGFDHLVILGDLLTYGCEPHQVLDIAEEAVSRDGAILVKGNHDQLYFDLVTGECGYFNRLPDWLREAADWTHTALADRNIADAFAWRDSISLGGVFFAHANPFAYGDWTYLNAEPEFSRAAAALGKTGHNVGIFGHTHRPKIIQVPAKGNPVLHDAAGGAHMRLDIGPASPRILADPGSAGQPRNSLKSSTMMFLASEKAAIDIEIRPFDYDFAAIRDSVNASSLSEPTKKKLLEYFPCP